MVQNHFVSIFNSIGKCHQDVSETKGIINFSCQRLKITLTIANMAFSYLQPCSRNAWKNDFFKFCHTVSVSDKILP